MLPTMVPVRSTLDASQNKVLRHEARSAYGRYGSWPCENAWRKHRRAEISARWPCAVIFPDWRLFRSGSAPEADSRRLERFCNSRRTRVCDDYALITAMSGWTPKMFMTRVRL